MAALEDAPIHHPGIAIGAEQAVRVGEIVENLLGAGDFIVKDAGVVAVAERNPVAVGMIADPVAVRSGARHRRAAERSGRGKRRRRQGNLKKSAAIKHRL